MQNNFQHFYILLTTNEFPVQPLQSCTRDASGDCNSGLFDSQESPVIVTGQR